MSAAKNIRPNEPKTERVAQAAILTCGMISLTLALISAKTLPMRSFVSLTFKVRCSSA